MSSVDDRVVSMTFDNRTFERNLSETLKSIDALTKALSFSNARNGFDDLTKAAEGFKS